MKPAPHAIVQALTRYGLKLTQSDLVNICMSCEQGYGRMAYMEDGTERHLVSYSGKQLITIYAPYTGPNGRVKSVHGKIITFLPAHSFNPASPEYKAGLKKLPKGAKKGKPARKARQQRGY